MTRPRFLYFDLGNVLVEFDHDLMCYQLAELGGVGFAEVKQWIFGDGGLMRQIDVGVLSQDDCYQRFCSLTGSNPTLEAFRYAAAAIFSLRFAMVPVVTQLVSAKQPIGILSNTCQPHWDYVSDGRYGMIPGLFDVIVLSYQVQAAKPDRAIYETAAEMAGYDPGDILFVDDRSENVAGAQAAGFQSLLFTSPRQFIVDLRKQGLRFNL